MNFEIVKIEILKKRNYDEKKLKLKKIILKVEDSLDYILNLN